MHQQNCCSKTVFKVYATARRVELMKDLEEIGATVMHCDVTNTGC